MKKGFPSSVLVNNIPHVFEQFNPKSVFSLIVTSHIPVTLTHVSVTVAILSSEETNVPSHIQLPFIVKKSPGCAKFLDK